MFTDEQVINVEELTSRITFLIGKNGSGKSTQLRLISTSLSGNPEWDCRYVVPERGGNLMHDAGVESQFISDPNFAFNSRRVNQLSNFKQQSFTQFLRLERAVLRRISNDRTLRDSNYTFADELEKLNQLLPMIAMVPTEYGFTIESKIDGSNIHPTHLSSGESELISLGIEVLEFSLSSQVKQKRLLLLDEPDVHLHPDLQSRFVNFLIERAISSSFQVIVATHSTAFIGGLGDAGADAQLAILNDVKFQENQGEVVRLTPSYHRVDNFIEKVLPIFGANPLSNVFAKKPVLLVEGDDDLRIWEQVTRSTQGKFNYHPCPVDGKPNFQGSEIQLEQILSSLYDDAKAYSLRDGDGDSQQLDDTKAIVRIRMTCREIENLLLSDEVIEFCGTNWDDLRQRCEEYVVRFPESKTSTALTAFREGGFDRLNADVKGFRTILPDLLGVNWSWEVLVGKAISDAILKNVFSNTRTSLRGMLSDKFWTQIFEPCLA